METMEEFPERLKRRAGKRLCRLIFPEPEDSRILTACRILKDEGLAEPLLVGDPEKMKETARKARVNFSDFLFFNLCDNSEISGMAEKIYQLRQHKGLTPEEAKKMIQDPMYCGTMLLHTGQADGIVAGACHPTSWTFRPLLQIIPRKTEVKYVSSYFLMSVPDTPYGYQGLFIFADCGLIPNPTAEQLAEIAIVSAETARNLLQIEPRVALLSFSTRGSGDDPLTVKVLEAARMARERRPDLAIDGELQADAALVPEVARQKMVDSPVAGKANVLIFPDLNSGNIAYKLVQRLANAKAWGPLVQGLSKPASDLSRGCSVEDIVAVGTIVAVQAQNTELC
ncbi:MAG: phosphate acetyltransferase [Candidatus Omnitrophota bacterium]